MLLSKAFNTDVTNKVIFLDFDGVLSTSRTIASYGDILAFDPVSVKILQNICSVSGAKIVCTSSRTFHSGDYDVIYHETKAHFEKAGFDWQYMHPDWTVNKGALQHREDHIRDYLKEHPEIIYFSVVDDEDTFPENFVKIDENNGVQYQDIFKICQCLGMGNEELGKVLRFDRDKKTLLGQLELPFEQSTIDKNEQILRSHKPCQQL